MERIHLQATPIANFIVPDGDVVLEGRVPLLQHNLLRRSPDLRGNQLLEVADRVCRLALHADLLAQAVVTAYGG